MRIFAQKKFAGEGEMRFVRAFKGRNCVSGVERSLKLAWKSRSERVGDEPRRRVQRSGAELRILTLLFPDADGKHISTLLSVYECTLQVGWPGEGKR